MKMGRINIELDEELHKKAKIYAATHELSLIQLVNQAIDEKLKKK